MRKFIALCTSALLAVGLGAVGVTGATAVTPTTATEDCSPSEAWTETIEHDAVTEEQTVPGAWWVWSPNESQGVFEGPPAFPSDERGTWQGPKTGGGPGQDEVGTFQQGGGNSSWFHREASTTKTVVVKDAWTETIQHPAVTCEEPEEPEVDYCDPANKPGGVSIATWLENNGIDGADCFKVEYTNECGSFNAKVLEAPVGISYGFIYVEGANQDTVYPANSMPAGFEEDYNGGSVDITVYLVGGEKDYLVGTDLPNLWDNNGKTFEVDTDCELNPIPAASSSSFTDATCDTLGSSEFTVTAPNYEDLTNVRISFKDMRDGQGGAGIGEVFYNSDGTTGAPGEIITFAGPLTIPAGESMTFSVSGVLGESETGYRWTVRAAELNNSEARALFEDGNVEQPSELECAGPEPETKVEYGEWVTGEYDCDDTEVMETREVSTTTYSIVDGQWVGTTEVTEESQLRPLTAQEIAELDCQLPTPPPLPEEPEELAYTGAEDVAPWGLYGGALLLAGIVLAAAPRIRRALK